MAVPMAPATMSGFFMDAPHAKGWAYAGRQPA
jgi:hypothetical protein